VADRARRRIERHLAEARPAGGEIDRRIRLRRVPTISKAQVMALASGDGWTGQGANLLLFGPPGGGKSHLAARTESRLRPCAQIGIWSEAEVRLDRPPRRGSRHLRSQPLSLDADSAQARECGKHHGGDSPKRIARVERRAGLLLPTISSSSIKPGETCRIMRVDLIGVSLCLKHALAAMAKAGCRAIVNTAFVAGLQVPAGPLRGPAAPLIRSRVGPPSNMREFDIAAARSGHSR
jgi:hypothetical protein